VLEHALRLLGHGNVRYQEQRIGNDGRAKDFIMGIDKPFHRNIRSHIPSPNAGYNSSAFIRDRDYARNSINYLRAYFIIQGDFEKLCEYIEPSPESLTTYSYRIHELLMRICIELEANLKAILAENINSARQLNMGIYRKIDVTHHLSSYELVLPTWHGPRRLIKPFESWLGAKGYGTGKSPDWYNAYNASKHDREEAFKQSNMKYLIDALAGLLVVISSQFRTETFSAGGDTISGGSSSYHELKPAIGSLFRIQFPDDWADSEKYDFDWQKLQKDTVRFSKIDYDKIDVS
jgi:hypothetical protein